MRTYAERAAYRDAQRITPYYRGCDRYVRRGRVDEADQALQILRTSPFTASDFDALDRETDEAQRESRRILETKRAFASVGGGFLRAAWQRMRPRVLEIVAGLIEAAERRGRWEGRAIERYSCLVENRQGQITKAPGGTWASCRD